MKNPVKSCLIAVACVITVPFCAMAAPENTQKMNIPEVNIRHLTDNVIYTKIQLGDLPRVVKAEAMIRYSAYAIYEAFRGTDNSYKLILKRNGRELEVRLDESGCFLKK